MDDSASQMNSGDIDWMTLIRRLRARALLWFKERGCYEVDSVLPGTNMSAEDLTSKAILELHRNPEWRSKSSNGDPFPFALTVMQRDFLDVVRKAEAKRTVIHEDPDIGSWESQDDNSFTTNDGVQAAEDESYLRFLDRTLRPDPMLKAYFEAVILKGLTKRADIAQELGVTAREVTDIQRRLASKSRLIECGYLVRPQRTQKV